MSRKKRHNLNGLHKEVVALLPGGLRQLPPPTTPFHDMKVLIGKCNAASLLNRTLEQTGFLSELKKIHEGLGQLVDSLASLPVWNMTLTITHTFFNFKTISWDAESFARATVAHHIPPGTPLSPAPADSKFMSGFPTPKLGPFEQPNTLVDCCGQILIWYLPGILDPMANEVIITATKSIEHHLKPQKKSIGSSWWWSDHFKPGITLPSGCNNFSPAAFPQGHMSIEKLTTSQSLRTQDAQVWMKQVAPVEELLDKLFSIISPKLHVRT